MYFEDFQPGQTSQFGAFQVTDDEIKEFASKYDPQFFHLDEEAAKESLAPGLGSCTSFCLNRPISLKDSV